MTRPHLHHDEVGDLVVADDTPVLLRRELHHGRAALSRFADPVWDLLPAVPDRHSAQQSLHWQRYPQPLRHACKLYVFALLNIVEHTPRMTSSRSAVPAVKTIWADLAYLRPFLRWLVDRGVGRFADVTTADLDLYYAHVMDEPASGNQRRKLLLAVQRLHLYRGELPEFARLPGRVLWGGVSAALLAGAPAPQRIDNRTPRIHPDVMGPLLSAALLVTETIAADIAPAARRLVAMRAAAVGAVPPHLFRPDPQQSRWLALKQRLDYVLPALVDAGHGLPGRRENRRIVLDAAGLALAGMLDRKQIESELADALAHSGLPIRADLLRVTQITLIKERRWRDHPIETAELPALMRYITTACFVVIAYLSGLRTGEVLNLHRGAVTRDPKLNMIFLSGRQLKTADNRATRSPSTIPWVINEHGAHAIAVLEDLSPSDLLFPAERFGTPGWLDAARTRTTGTINDDIEAFIRWFNTTIATTVDHPVIGTDPHGPITARRFRRTLAWHIVRRPGGTIAGAQQYGHLSTRITHGYAGQADAGFLDELTFEEFLLRAEQIYDDHHRLDKGEHVSGPAADLYRQRINTTSTFAGRTVTTTAQAATALTNPVLQIHHGALLTCVWRPDTAACRSTNESDLAHGSDGDGPSWPHCRPSCTNIARTDRDVAALRAHTDRLRADLALPGLPEPLRLRITERIGQHDAAITAHQNGAT